AKVALAVGELEGIASINIREHCRISSTIQYLKRLNINFIIKKDGDKRPLSHDADIRKVLQERKDPMTSITVYTDGSTDPNLNHRIQAQQLS
ncbi:MAG TPA: hypothetical protein VIH61_04215, partial [Waddliaceae bacterium]